MMSVSSAPFSHKSTVHRIHMIEAGTKRNSYPELHEVNQMEVGRSQRRGHNRNHPLTDCEATVIRLRDKIVHKCNHEAGGEDSCHSPGKQWLVRSFNYVNTPAVCLAWVRLGQQTSVEFLWQAIVMIEVPSGVSCGWWMQVMFVEEVEEGTAVDRRQWVERTLVIMISFTLDLIFWRYGKRCLIYAGLEPARASGEAYEMNIGWSARRVSFLLSQSGHLFRDIMNALACTDIDTSLSIEVPHIVDGS